MILAAVPAATVLPLSKNMGFIAMGAFGLIAAFLINVMEHKSASLRWRLQVCLAVWFLFAHVVGSLAARTGLAVITPYLQPAMTWGFEHLPEAGDRDVVVINDPGPVYMMTAIYRANYGGVLPTSVRALTMGLTGVTVSRPDDRTLIATSKSGDFFSTPIFGPIHVAYAVRSAHEFIFAGLRWKKGDRVVRKGWTIEILETTPAGEPTSAAYHFDSSLDSPNRLWLKMYWKPPDIGYVPFVLPKVGETVDVPGPRGKR
jgi:hypothetical protein